MPEACAATCVSSINVQRMSVHAAVSGDIDLLKLAVLHDPLVGAICTPEEVWQMVDEMVVAQAEWLPQYADAVPAAKERLAKGNREDTRLGRAWRAVEVRSIEQLRADKAASPGSRIGMPPIGRCRARERPDRRGPAYEEEAGSIRPAQMGENSMTIKTRP